METGEGRPARTRRRSVAARVVMGIGALAVVAFVVDEGTRAGGSRVVRWLRGGQEVAAYVPPVVTTEPAGADVADPEFAPEQIWLQATPLHCDPPLLAAEEADSLVEGDELVLGVVINGDARAYPLNRMSGPQDEVLNDTIGGEPVLVTWCMKSGAGIVHSRLVDGKELTFRCAGLWRKNMLFADEESGSIWSQLVGKAVSGPRKGTTLKPVASAVMGWTAWRELHPETRVMIRPKTADQFRCAPEHLTPSGLALGVIDGAGTTRVWPLKELSAATVVNAYVGEEPVVIAYDPARQAVFVHSRLVRGHELTFHESDGQLVDDRTGTTWEPHEGRAVEGPLAGSILKPVPAILAFGEVWSLFGLIPGA